MPKSKHRHKNRPKSVAHPGRVRVVRPAYVDVAPEPEVDGYLEYERVEALYFHPLFDQWEAAVEGSPEYHGEMTLTALMHDLYDPETQSFGAISKDKFVDNHTKPHSIGYEYTIPPLLAVDEAEAVLAFFVAHEIIELDADAITLHRRFEVNRREHAAVLEASE
jgi:hypothetical protein